MDRVVSSEIDAFGISTKASINEDGGLSFLRTQDVEPILNANKEAQFLGDGYTKSRDLKRSASIPLVLVEKWLKEEGIDVFNQDHWPAVRRKLNSSEYAYLRTSTGMIK